MIKRFITILLAFSSFCAMAQKNDYVWLSGYGSHWGFSSSQGLQYGATTVDFNSTPQTLTYDSIGMGFDATNASVADIEGNLQFYTNGIFVANSFHEPIENGDSLNPGYIQYEWDTLIQHFGYRERQGAIILPSIANPSQYYIIHTCVDSFNTVFWAKHVYYTLVDMSENAGRGEVLLKNQPIISNLVSAEITATKHSNGRYWWLLVHKDSTDCFYRVLLDESGFHVMPDLTCSGTGQKSNTAGSVCFSPDGTKYAYLTWLTGLSIYDFDRCTGTLTNGRILSLPRLADRGYFSCGLSFSPNSRFLYLSAYEHLYQFDTDEVDVFGSIDTVGTNVVGAGFPFNDEFLASQIGPDGKIYISLGLGDTVYHVINQPNLKGNLCDLSPHSFRLKSPGCGVPNYPNYRLGALPGSACDTITGIKDIAEKEKQLKIFPNPAADVATIDYGYTDWSKGEATMEISNNLGQVVHSQTLPMYSGFQKLEVGKYPSGAYTVYIKRKGVVVATGKLVKE